MASPREIVFGIFDSSGAPLTGQSPTFLMYKKDDLSDVTPPSISEIAHGMYRFTPVLTANHSLYYMIDCGSSALDRYQFDVIRAETFDIDLIGGISTSVGTILTDVGTILTDVGASVWDALTADHLTSATFGALMHLLKQVLSGRVKVNPTLGTETVYAENGTTPLQVMDLFKSDGVTVAGLDAYERKPHV